MSIPLFRCLTGLLGNPQRSMTSLLTGASSITSFTHLTHRQSREGPPSSQVFSTVSRTTQPAPFILQGQLPQFGVGAVSRSTFHEQGQATGIQGERFSNKVSTAIQRFRQEDRGGSDKGVGILESCWLPNVQNSQKWWQVTSHKAKEREHTSPGGDAQKTPIQKFRQAVALQVAAGITVGALLWVAPTASAVDPLKTCACLLKECRVELAKCIADPKCAANVACLQTCNNRPDETECQIGCGDLFENNVVDEFNDCAVTRKGCVPKKLDEGRYPVPPPSALVADFSTLDFTGKWYISSGYNRTFDTFDCQLHEFTASPSELSGKLSWRIATPDGGFFTRSTVQNFVQDPKQPGVLYNHGNEFLHYQDDWYVLGAKTEKRPDDYVFIYYRGSNDAWDGYGGAVVYTRSKTLPPSIVPELEKAAKRVNLDFKKFTQTDNTCGPEPPLFARLEKKVEEGEKFVVEEVEELEEKVGKAELSLLGRLGKGADKFRRDEERFFRELGDEEKALLADLQMGAEDVGKLFGKAIPIRKLR